MGSWQEFEKECLAYLQDTFSNERVSFKATGGSDSNAPDIKVYLDGLNKFNIEVKSASAQSGQFVVLQENGQFVFSSKNKSSSDEATPFINYMNNNFDRYKNVGTAGIAVDMPEQDFLSWIINHYRSKNEQFVITKNNKGFVLFPTEKYGEYFKTSCVYRIKKSGSNDIPKSYIDKINERFSLFDKNATVFAEGKKVYLITTKSMSVKDKFTIADEEYMVSEIIGNAYYLRKLSKTRNANIIFSISLQKEQDEADLIAFKKELS